MGLQYVFGGPGTGKTEFCLKGIVNGQKADDHSAFIYIVPEQFSLESERCLIEKAKSHCLMQTQVLSFGRLAYHVFSRCGFTNKALLDRLGKTMLLRKVVGSIGKELVYFGKNADKQGFVEKLGGLLTECIQYGITRDTLETVIEKLPQNSLALKLQDLCTVYKAFEEMTGQEYMSSDHILDVLADKINDAGFLAGAHIWIDGFYGFTPQEFKIIARLLTIAEEVTVTFPVKDVKTLYPMISMQDPYFEIKQTIHKLSLVAASMNAPVHTPVYFHECRRYGEDEALYFLNRHYFHINQSYQKPVENIKISVCTDRYEETDWVASEILALVRDRNLRYNEIGIVGQGLEDYQLPVQMVFKRYGIPFFLDTVQDMLSHPLTEFIRSIVDIIASNWSYEAVFRMLKTGITPIGPSAVDQLENYVLAYGIAGYKWKLDRWTFGRNVIDTETLACANENKAIIQEILHPFTNGIEPGTKKTLREFCQRIYAVLDEVNIEKTLNGWLQEWFQDTQSVQYHIHSQIWGKIGEVFDKMVSLLGDEVLDVKEFGKILESGLGALDIGVIPGTREQVIIGDLERSRLPRLKALFVVGVNEGRLPAVYQEDGLLNDEDRSSLLTSGLEIGMDRSRLIVRQHFLIYNTLTKPSDYLFFSYPCNGPKGENLHPSRILERMKELFPALKENRWNGAHAVTLPLPMFYKMGRVVREAGKGGEIEPVHQGLLNWYNNQENYQYKLNKMKTVLDQNAKYDGLSQEVINKIFGKDIYTSVSRLEQYVRCPFAYFASYHLNARERAVYRLDAMDIGQVFHQVLESFLTEIDHKGIPVDRLSKSDVETITSGLVDTTMEQVKDDIFLSSAGYGYMGKRIKKISQTSIWALLKHLEKGDFQVYASEFGFDAKNAGPLTGIVIQINGEHNFILSGRIDRIDILNKDDQCYVKIIDYKSGQTQFDLSDIYFGMQLQLLLYLKAFIDMANQNKWQGNITFKPGGILYFHVDLPVINGQQLHMDQPAEAIREEIERYILKEYKMSGMLLKNTDVIMAMDRDIQDWSHIIPARVKKEGNQVAIVDSGTNAVDEADFELLQQYVLGKVRQIGQSLLKGEVPPRPYKKGPYTGCDYCRYGGICGFDGLDREEKFAMVHKISGSGKFFENLSNEKKNK